MDYEHPQIKVEPRSGISFDEQKSDVVDKVTGAMASAYEEFSKEAMDNAEKSAARAYYENPDPNVPDYDVEDITKKIEEASYPELPIWRRSFENTLKNLEEVRIHLSQYPDYIKYLETLSEGDGEAKLEADEQLALFNSLQNEGITMEMQINAYNVKYDVNKRFLESMIAKIDKRIETELDMVNNAPTSKKNMMEYVVFKKHRKAILESGKDYNKKVIWVTEGMMKAHMQSNTIDWVNEALKAGHRPATIVNNYRKHLKAGTLNDYLLSSFKVDEIPQIVGFPKEKFDFLMYWLAYVSSLLNLKKPNVRIQIFKTNAILLIRNLSDIGINVYDLVDCDYTENEDGIETTYTVVPEGDDKEAYEEAKRVCGILYLNRVKSLAEQIYAMAFDK